MRTDHVVALMERVLEKANSLIIAELDQRGHPGLVPSHGAILARLYDNGELPMGVLAEAIGRKKNTVTTLVKRLEDEGYVKRTSSPEDSRVALVSLTARGEAFRADFMDISAKLLASVWKDMRQDEKETLISGLQRLLTNLG